MGWSLARHLLFWSKPFTWLFWGFLTLSLLLMPWAAEFAGILMMLSCVPVLLSGGLTSRHILQSRQLALAIAGRASLYHAWLLLSLVPASLFMLYQVLNQPWSDLSAVAVLANGASVASGLLLLWTWLLPWSCRYGERSVGLGLQIVPIAIILSSLVWGYGWLQQLWWALVPLLLILPWHIARCQQLLRHHERSGSFSWCKLLPVSRSHNALWQLLALPNPVLLVLVWGCAAVALLAACVYGADVLARFVAEPSLLITQVFAGAMIVQEQTRRALKRARYLWLRLPGDRVQLVNRINRQLQSYYWQWWLAIVVVMLMMAAAVSYQQLLVIAWGQWLLTIVAYVGYFQLLMMLTMWAALKHLHPSWLIVGAMVVHGSALTLYYGFANSVWLLPSFGLLLILAIYACWWGVKRASLTLTLSYSGAESCAIA